MKDLSLLQVHSDLAGYLSPESSLDKVLLFNVKSDTEPPNPQISQNLIEKSTRNDEMKAPSQSDLSSLANSGSIFESNSQSPTDAKYYCSTDEPEPWDLIKLNLQASFICLSAKVSALCSAHHEATSCRRPVGSSTSGNCSSTDTSPTEADSGIGLQEKTTPKCERKDRLRAVESFEEASDCDIVKGAKSPSRDISNLDDTVSYNNRPKLESIMETSREDILENDDLSLKIVDKDNNSDSLTNSAKNDPTLPSESSVPPDHYKDKIEVVPSSNLESVIPGIIKLRGTVDGAVRTARLVHSLHRLQLPTETLHQMHSLLYRRDVCFSQALTTSTTALLNKFWSRAGSSHQDQVFLTVLQKLGPLLQFECLLSCIGSDFNRICDMVVAIEDLTAVKFVLVGGAVPTASVTGNRCNLRVLLAVPDAVLDQLVCEEAEEGRYFSFHVTPVFFNIGINEEATMAAKLGQDGSQYRNNLDSYTRLCDYHNRFTKLSLPPLECHKRVWSQPSSYSDTQDMMSKLKAAVHSTKSKNVEVLSFSAAITRAMHGLRFVSCKSAKDRTSMSATLEQTNILTDEFDLAQMEAKRCLNAMRAEGTRMQNVYKNIHTRKYAFTVFQLATFPKDYIPPQGSYGAKIT